jgi:hypothetical protein
MGAESDVGLHPSEFEFDLAVQGSATPAFEAHLATCTECRDRVDQLRAHHEPLALQADPPSSAVITRRARWSWVWGALLALLSCGAGLSLLLTRPTANALLSTEGGPTIEAYVKPANGPPRRLVAGERVPADARVQIACRAAGFSRLTFFTSERGCEVTFAGSWRAEGGSTVVPASWAPSVGRLYVVFASSQIAPLDFAAALRATPGGCETGRAPDLATAGFIARGLLLSTDDR